MTNQVYLAGYQSTKLPQLLEFMDTHGCDLYDIRFKPWSPNPSLTRHGLANLLGNRYRWLSELGNRLYKSGGVEFVDFQEATQIIRASPKPVLLLCACSDAEHCHRTAAGKELAKLGFQVEEISPRPIENKMVQGGLL